MLKTIHSWWWSAYLVIFTCFILPIPVLGYDLSFQVRVWASIIAFLGGLLLELSAHPNTRFSDARFIPTFLRNNPFFFLMLVFITLNTISVFSSVDPQEALIGKSSGNSDFFIGNGSYIFNLIIYLNCLVFYLNCVREKNVLNRMLFTILYVGVFVSFVALLEAFFHISLLLFKIDDEGQIPFYTFYGRGHLAGFLLFPFGVLLFHFKNKKTILNYFLLFLLAFTIGITTNRTSLIAIILAFLWLLYFYKKEYMTILILSVALFSVGNYVSQSTLAGAKTSLLLHLDSSGRSMLWEAAIKGILEKPFLGWGNSDLSSNLIRFTSEKKLYEFVKTIYPNETYQFAEKNVVASLEDTTKKLVLHRLVNVKTHNFLLEVAYEYGIPSLTVLLLIFSFVFIKNYKNLYFLAFLMYFLYFQTWNIIDTSQAVTWLFLAILGANTIQVQTQEIPENCETAINTSLVSE
jgi:O-antigen ligase